MWRDAWSLVQGQFSCHDWIGAVGLASEVKPRSSGGLSHLAQSLVTRSSLGR